MSRDWRPFEAVIADEEAHMMRGEYIHDSKIVMHYKGQDKPLYNLEPRTPFPNLCYLLEGFEMKTYDAIKDDPQACRFYEYIEGQIGQLADTLRAQIKEGKRLNLDDVNIVDPIIKDWFMGELDPSFYYREENNEKFCEWIDAQIAKSKESVTMDVDSWTTEDALALMDAVNEMSKDITVTSLYITKSNIIEMEYMDLHENEYELQEVIQIDLRKAGTCKELCDKYAPVLCKAAEKELHEIEAELDADRDEDWLEF